MEKDKKEREYWIDYTKLFACILVVIGHLLQGLNKANITWNENLYYYINGVIYSFHMPLFMCLSGYLYSKYAKIENRKDYIKFIKKKLINLGIPYFVFYIVYVLVNMMFSSSVNSQKGIIDIINIFTNPIPPFWFLYALFFIFVFVPIIENICKRNTKLIFILCMILNICSKFLNIKVYMISIVLEYAVYFYLGVVILKIIKDDKKNKKSIILVNDLLFIIVSIGYCILIKKNSINNNMIGILRLMIAIYGTIISIETFRYISNWINKKCKMFKYLSKYTFPIYLMHTIFSAGIRIVLIKIGINNFYIHFVLGFVFGIIGPIIVAKLLEKSRYGNIFIYPMETIKQIKEDRYEDCNDRT